MLISSIASRLFGLLVLLLLLLVFLLLLHVILPQPGSTSRREPLGAWIPAPPSPQNPLASPAQRPMRMASGARPTLTRRIRGSQTLLKKPLGQS